jgi:hypothetical protein
MGIQRDGAVGTGDETRDAAVIAYFGDGATAQGDVNESFVFASVYNAPVVFFCQNNQWAISEPERAADPYPAYQRARGFGFPGVRVDGNDVLAVTAVTKAALTAARRGEGPTFIEAFTYRMGRHTTSDDPTRYRSPAEVEEWKLKDPIARRQGACCRERPRGRPFFDEVERDADELAAHVPERVPRDAGPGSRRHVRLRLPRAAPPAGGGAPPGSRVPRQLRGGRARDEPDTSDQHDRQGHQLGPPGAMENDPKVLIMGEDVGKLGGVFRVTDGLQKDFGEDRVIDTPLAESGIIGRRSGLALRGYRPVCEIQFDGFIYPAYDRS